MSFQLSSYEFLTIFEQVNHFLHYNQFFGVSSIIIHIKRASRPVSFYCDIDDLND